MNKTREEERKINTLNSTVEQSDSLQNSESEWLFFYSVIIFQNQTRGAGTSVGGLFLLK